MPPAVPLVAGIAASAAIPATGIFATTIFGSLTVGGLVSGLVGAGVSGLTSRFLSSGAKGALSVGDQNNGIQTIVRSAVEPHKIIYGEHRVAGTLVYFRTGSNDPAKPNKFLEMCIVLTGHEVEQIGDVYFNDTKLVINTGYGTPEDYGVAKNPPFTDLVEIVKFKGPDDQLYDSAILGNGNQEWTTNHRLRGLAYLSLRLNYNQTSFADGVPQIRAVVKGKKVYDPRTGLTAYSDNWALCVRDYLTNPYYGFGATDIDDASVIAAANICDELVTLADGSTEKRYTCNGVIDTGGQLIDNLNSLVSSGAGAVIWSEGKFSLYAGAYDTPGITVDETWLRGDIAVQARPNRSDIFNGVRGVFIDTNSWQATDFPPVKNAVYKAQDNGEEIIKDIELPFTNSSATAQRIAKIVLEKSRQGIVVEMPCNLKALQLKAWDTVLVNNSILGWSAKPFRILEWGFDNDGGINLTMQEESSGSYNWANGEETTIDPAPDTDLADPFITDTPQSFTVTEQLYDTIGSSGVQARAVLSWDPPGESGFIIGYDVEYKPYDDTGYISFGRVSGTLAYINDLAPGYYDFRVRAVNSINAVSDWVGVEYKEIVGLSAPPADITGFAIFVTEGVAHLSWDQSTDLDVRVGGNIRLRWTSKSSGASWKDSIDVIPSLSGIATGAAVPLLAGTYFIKAVDSSGNESVNAASIITDYPNIYNLNFVLDANQGSNFGGTKNNMVVNDGTLRLDGASLFDDGSGLFDDGIGYFDMGGGAGFALSGSYQFDNYIDQGNVYKSRVSLYIESFTEDVGQLFDAGGGYFDDGQGLFDGDDIAGVDIVPYIRTTNNDPAGAPIWSAWKRFYVGDYVARAFQFKLEVESRSSNLNVQVSVLNALIDVPDRTESGEDIAITVSGLPVTFTKPFFVSPNISVSIQDAQAGDYYTITGKTMQGFTVTAYNAGVAVARVIDWAAKAY